MQKWIRIRILMDADAKQWWRKMTLNIPFVPLAEGHASARVQDPKEIQHVCGQAYRREGYQPHCRGQNDCQVHLTHLSVLGLM